jgi:hypothetical protein
MVHGRLNEAWDRNSHLLAMLANPHRDRKKRSRPFEPSDFHPFRTTKRRSGDSIKEARALFESFKRRRPKESVNG